jgi:hypothetical protein
MKLKVVISKADFDGLDEARKALYVASGDKYVLEADGFDEHPAVANLKKALDAERTTASSAQREYNKLKAQIGDMDPDAARAAMAKMQELADKKMLDDGQIEELFKQRLDRINADHANQLKAKDAALAETTKRLEGKSGLVKKLMLEGEITRLAADPKIGVKGSMLPFVISAFTQAGIDGTRWDLDEHDKIVALKGDQIRFGKDASGPMPIAEGFDLLRAVAPDFFMPSTGAGAQNQGSGRQQGGVYTISREDAKDPSKYRAARDEAAKANVPFQIAPQ